MRHPACPRASGRHWAEVPGVVAVPGRYAGREGCMPHAVLGHVRALCEQPDMWWIRTCMHPATRVQAHIYTHAPGSSRELLRERPAASSSTGQSIDTSQSPRRHQPGGAQHNMPLAAACMASPRQSQTWTPLGYSCGRKAHVEGPGLMHQVNTDDWHAECNDPPFPSAAPVGRWSPHAATLGLAAYLRLPSPRRRLELLKGPCHVVADLHDGRKVACT